MTNPEKAGQQLAAMHQITAKRFGFSQENFIGSSVQFNTQYDDWSAFYKIKRLGFQVTLLRQNDETKLVDEVEAFLPCIETFWIHIRLDQVC